MVLHLSGVFVLDKCLYLLKGYVRGQKKSFKVVLEKKNLVSLKGKVLGYIECEGWLPV